MAKEKGKGKPFDNELRGVLFKNEQKTDDNHPSMKGSVTVEGVEYYMSAWTKESETCGKYLSLSLTRKEGQPKGKPSGKAEDDDPPF